MVNGKTVVDIIKRKLRDAGSIVNIPLQKGRMLTVRLMEDGLEVTDLGNQPFLPWNVFEQTVDLMVRKGGRAERGDAMSSKLGDKGLPLDSIEGHIAHVVYDKQEGDSVFRRISPIAAILVWAGICVYEPRELILI